MASNKNTKKSSKTLPRASDKGKPKKSKVKVRVVEEVRFENKNKEKKIEEKVEKVEEKFDFSKNIKTKDDVSPKRSQIFHQSEAKKIDNKKEVGEEIKIKEKNIKNDKNKTYQSFNMYKKLAISFVLLTLLLVFLVFYLSFNSVSITLYPEEERISDNIILDIVEDETDEEGSSQAIVGDLEEVEIEIESRYPANGKKEVGVDIIGKVEIVNNRDVEQILVATTRLLSPNDKLFRIKERVQIPPGEKREVEIYTENPSPDMAIAPTEFTIPGLWAGLQDKVYAQNNESFKYEMEVEKYVEQNDIEKALKDITFRLKEKAENDLAEKYKDRDKIIFELDENSINIDREVEVGDEVDDFTLKASAVVRIVAFNESEVENMARNKIYLILPQDKELLSFNNSNFSYNLDGFNSQTETATINVSFNAKMVTKKDAQIVNKEEITGLKEKQLIAYLNTFNQFSAYTVKFSPSFIRKVPRIKDKIKIEMKYKEE